MIDKRQWQELFYGCKGDVMFMEMMKGHTSLRIGGPADVFVSPKDGISLRNLIIALKERLIHFMPIGGGTNLLVRDGGIEGVVVSLKYFRHLKLEKEEGDNILLSVESGVPLQRLVRFARENGYAGIDGLVGIPGFLGGAIAGNAGAFGYEMKDVIVSVTLVRSNGLVVENNANELGFEYRGSNIPVGTTILSANIRLRRDSKEDVAKRMDDFLKEKQKRQPLSEWSAGCVYKNPMGSATISGAGKLIDEAGCKGMRIGDAEVSAVHANFFINRGNATASDFIRLMDEVREKVMKVFGVELEPEIRIVGRLE